MIQCALLTIFSASVVFAQSKADYFVIADPSAYTIFNQYQQSMSAADKREALTFAPLRVENEDQTLGDQITRAAKCVFGGQTVFLLKNDDGEFSGETNNGRRTFKNCIVIDDTVVVVRDRAIAVTPIEGRVRQIDKGVSVIRFFKSGARYYVRALDAKPFFGWSSMEPSSAWKKQEKTTPAKSIASDTTLSEIYRQRIAEKIEAANEAYKACFGHFNTHTGDQKSVPSWSCENSGAGMRCELSGPWKKGGRLEESTHALVQELESILMGSDFQVKYREGVMEIRKRGGN